MFEKIATAIPGCYLLKPRVMADDRGLFIKLFHDKMFDDLGLRSDFKEEYYSTSKKGVIRGLHFQAPPEQHIKCISCIQGEIFDTVVDLRTESPTYGEHLAVVMNAQEPAILYIPEGLAHGFMALSDNCIFLNKTTTVFNADCDTGIHWDSCGIDWPDLPKIVSEKDKQMQPFSDFSSPF
jgi:dTDP-4-dehydrorhamnose 3,5-epimerase